MPLTRTYVARYIDASKLSALLERLFPNQWQVEVFHNILPGPPKIFILTFGISDENGLLDH